MGEPVVSECTVAQNKSENLENELKPMNDFKETPACGQADPSDAESGSVSGYFYFMETSQQLPSISSDDGTETYHSLEGEPVITDHDQDVEPYEGDPSDVTAPANTAEIIVDEDNQRDVERGPKKADAEVTTTADNEYSVDSGNDDENEHVTGQEQKRILISEEIVRILPRSLAELPWPLETVEEEIITSFNADNSDDDNVEQLPENAALTDKRVETIPHENTIIGRQDGFEPPVSSASTTPDSMNTVEAVMTAEALRNYVTINVDVVDGPGLLTSRSASNEGPKSLEQFDGGSRTYSDEELKMMEGQKLLTSQSEPLVGLKSSATFGGEVGTFCNEELNAIDMETSEHGKTIFPPGPAHPDEALLAVMEITLNSVRHFYGPQPWLTDSDRVVETSFQESSAPSGSSVMQSEADETCKTNATPEDMHENLKKRNGYERNDHEKRSDGISSAEDMYNESIRKAMDEMKRDGIYNPCFQGDNAHSITTCKANECIEIPDESPNEIDLENTRSFHDLVDQLRDKESDPNPGLEEIAVISLFEPEQENVQELKTTKVAFGRADEKPYSVELGDIGKAYEQPRRSYCVVCCLKVKKRVLSPDVIFLVFLLMFLVFCVIMRLVFNGPPHGHRQHYGNTPAPTIQ